MTPEAQHAASFLAFSAQVSGLLDAHPYVAYAAGALAFAGVVGMRLGTPASPSVRPSATPSQNGRGDARTHGRSGSGRRALPKAVRVATSAPPKPKRWVIEGLVPEGPNRPWWALLAPWWWPPRGYITNVLGTGGVGKSFLLLDLALAALTGGDWLGQPVRRCKRVLYCDAELEVEVCRQRAYTLARGRGLAAPPKGLHYLSLQDCSLASTRERVEGETVVREGPAVEAVRRAARKCKADLILFDSLTIGSAGASLNDQEGWNRILSGMERWGVPVVVIDHLGKDATKGAVGSFMKQAKVRSILLVEAAKGGLIRVSQIKTNFGAVAEPFAVRAQRIGPDRHNPTASAYVPATLASADWEDGWTDEPLPSGPPALPPPGGGYDASGPRPLPVPLRALPRRVAPDDSCQKIHDHLERRPADAGPIPMKALQQELEAAKVLKSTAFYTHIKHLTEQGLVVEGEAGLALPGRRGEAQAG